MHPLKIIWDITNKCGYNCEICATYSKRSEVDFEAKKHILRSILSIGTKNIIEVDFAGGDPLFVKDSIQIIHSAINILGKEKISVTTTGKGINEAIEMGENLTHLLYNCEITIDELAYIPKYLRKDISYVTSNRDVIKRINKSIKNLTINIPILNTEVNNASIQQLVDEIIGIDVNNISVNLIRLMNVGRMNSQQYPSPYSPENFVRTFIKYAQNTRIKEVHIHCALRGKIENTCCNMLIDKVGIDCSGNVFACAWGGYVGDYNQYNISKNPFYIGNLLEKSLLDVLSSKRASELKKLIKEKPTRHCRVYCCKSSNNISIFEDTDPLFTY